MVMNQKLKPPVGGGDPDSTLATSASALDASSARGLPQMPAKNLGAIRARLERCTVVPGSNSSGINFDPFVKNLRGMSQITIGGIPLIILRTRSTLTVLSNRSPEDLYEVAQALMSVDFKRRCQLEREDSKIMYLCRISRTELNILMQTAAQARAVPEPEETIEPSSDGVVKFDQLKAKLAKCNVVVSPEAPNFNPRLFASGLRFAASFQDENEERYYYLVVGDAEIAYRLHVNPKKNGDLGATVLSYQDDTCMLVPDN
jgi:hypothetical protein